MQIGRGIGPVPLRDHDVALHALRTRRRFGGSSPCAMRVVQSPNRSAARCGPSCVSPPSIASRLAGLHAAHPGLRR